MERRTNIGSLTAAAVLVSLSWMVKASPLPGNIHTHPLGHSLASFATTNSFLYTNKIGSFNYRFTKPTLSFSKLIGFPQHQGVSLLNAEQISRVPTFTSGTNEAVPLGKNVVIGGAQVSSDSDSVSDFPPPSAMSNPPVPAFSLDLHPGDITEENSNKDDVKESTGFLSHDDDDHKFVLPENKTAETMNSGSSKPSHDEEKPIESGLEIERLVNKVINAPIRRIGMPVSNNDELAGNVRQNAGSSLETLPQSRQDSSLEQPIPFFSPENSHKSSSQEVFNEPRPNSQFSLPGSGGNYRFSPASSLPQPQHSSLFSGFNRFSLPQNSLQNPQSQPSLLHPSSNNNGLSEPTLSQNHEPLNFPNSPFQSQPQFPSYNPGLGANPPPPPGPEPENGFNPFFRSENYPEPPYESEFVNDRPLVDYEESSEHSGRSAGRNHGPNPPLNFAQGTLRNIRTEELLEVVRRKHIPPECVYNTISYGANGEDCIEARKKRQVQVVQ